MGPACPVAGALHRTRAREVAVTHHPRTFALSAPSEQCSCIADHGTLSQGVGDWETMRSSCPPPRRRTVMPSYQIEFVGGGVLSRSSVNVICADDHQVVASRLRPSGAPSRCRGFQRWHASRLGDYCRKSGWLQRDLCPQLVPSQAGWYSGSEQMASRLFTDITGISTFRMSAAQAPMTYSFA